MINQEIFPIVLLSKNSIENDTRSLVFTIIKSIETAYNTFLLKKNINQYKLRYKMLNNLWYSLAKNLVLLSDINMKNDEFKKNLMKNVNKNMTEIEKRNLQEKEIIYYLKLINKNEMCIEYINNALSNMINIRINKNSKPFNENQLKKIYVMLQFLCENYISFDLRKNNLFYQSLNDKLIVDVSMYNENNECVNIVFEIIQYLIGNGVIINKNNLKNIKNIKVKNAINKGENIYKVKQLKEKEIDKYMGKVCNELIIPIDINKLILSYVCLWH